MFNLPYVLTHTRCTIATSIPFKNLTLWKCPNKNFDWKMPKCFNHFSQKFLNSSAENWFWKQ